MIARYARIQRSAPPRRRRSKPRKGRVSDRKYLAWIASQPCLVSGRKPVTVHHVRRFGEQKNDRRTVPLMAEFHMHDFGEHSVEHGKAQFEKEFGVDLEKAIVEYNAMYGSIT